MGDENVVVTAHGGSVERDNHHLLLFSLTFYSTLCLLASENQNPYECVCVCVCVCVFVCTDLYFVAPGCLYDHGLQVSGCGKWS